jgi:molybdopterin-containing oxidoreductase family iron-sulfur binding subunit
MKRKFDHPAPSEREQLTGPKYWRSLDELSAAPGFQAQLAKEFPDGAAELDGTDRRQFMKIMAASFALGGVGLAGCRRPEKFILPYGKSVEGVVPGLPQYYATAMPLRRGAIPLLAETHQGRPTKLEGNPSYAPYGGATSLGAQASILDLYDPDRATAHTKAGAVLDAKAVNELLANLGKTYAATQGAGLAFLADESSSPTRARLVKGLKQKLPKALWAEYEPVQDEPPVAAAVACFGSPVKPLYQFAKAKRILSLEADFLGAESHSLASARQFANGRRVKSKSDDMNRLYVAESHLSLTGSMADHRLRLASSHVIALAAAVLGELYPQAKDQLAPLAQGVTIDPKWVKACADDLAAHKGASLVVAGAHQPASVHAIVYGINTVLENIGATVNFVTAASKSAASLADVAKSIKDGAVKSLVILGGNPAYNAPADLDWAALQKSVGDVIRLGYHVDETAALAGTRLAAAHFLESWGDARTADGTIVPVQPMILPLFGGLTENEVLARILQLSNPDPYALVAETISALAGGDAEKAMRRFLHDGVLAGSAYPVASVTLDARSAARLLRDAAKAETFSKERLEVRFVTDHKMDDGRHANNGWLHECPDPITKISWDNAILVSPRLAKELKITPDGSAIQVARVEENDFSIGKENARVFELTVGGRKLRGPVHIQPGLANYTVVIPLGYGRKVDAFHVGKDAGFNAYPLRTTDTMSVALGGKLTDTGTRALLANTQEHWSMEGRDIVREANFEANPAKDGTSYKENPAFVDKIGMESHAPSNLGVKYSIEALNAMTPAQRAKAQAEISAQIPRGNSLYTTPKFDGLHQWGMSIDLNTCIGCNACVVACQAENNIPIVGKDQVMRGREMHWIRLDRYYSDGEADGRAMADLFGGEPSGNRAIPEDPQISLQPVACMQCELAPCETVCPVNATVHDEEGLNTMAYNRCIGTRYCANNCPYKVRRFNFFDFNQRQLDSLYMSQLGPKGMPELVKMVKNPEVSIRMRGVMEKCTYCVQRIQNGKIQHKVAMAQAGTPDKVEVPDGTIKTACQQVCPVEAIEFGDILDKQSRVSQAKAREQDYALLGYLNIRPRTTYLGKLRNPNPAMPDYAKIATPFSRQEYDKKNHPAAHDDHAGHAHGQPAKPAHGAAPTKKGGHE